MKVLRVGDPHITVRNLDEAEKLRAFIGETADKHDVDHIEFLGDLMHTHAVIRVEVLDFWSRAVRSFSSKIGIIALVGNHDQPGSKEKEQMMNGLNILQSDNVDVVNTPRIYNRIAYIPYMSDKEAFIAAAQDLYNKGATEVLVSHQNFTVPLYHDLIDPSLVPQKHIITGHIHEQKTMGKVHQVGTPKWDTLTDANEDKGIWIFEHAENGSVISKEYISTKDVVTPITKVILTEGEPEIELNPKARNYLDLVGQTSWITQMKKKYKGQAHITGRPSDRKSMNINKDKASSMNDFLNVSFKPIDGVTKEEISGYLEGVLNV